MIDTHTHAIGPATRYPLSPRDLSGEWYHEAPHTAEELLDCMDEAGVSQAVLVQAVGAYSHDNAYAADASSAHPGRLVGACCIDVLAEDAVKTLRYWIDGRGMHGVRVFAIAPKKDSWLANERTFPVWEEAAALGAHVIVTAFAHQFDELRAMLVRHPDIAVSLDHCGFPDSANPEALWALADLPNLHLKVSSVVLESIGAEPEPFVEALVSRFGAERVMWGSDFSQTHDRSYAELVALARKAFGTLSEAQRHACFVETPRRLWPDLAT